MKSAEVYGSMQLTFYLNKTDTVAEVDLDDANGLQVLFGVDPELLAGRRTHPFDVHQILVFQQHLDPGYYFVI